MCGFRVTELLGWNSPVEKRCLQILLCTVRELVFLKMAICIGHFPESSVILFGMLATETCAPCTTINRSRRRRLNGSARLHVAPLIYMDGFYDGPVSPLTEAVIIGGPLMVGGARSGPSGGEQRLTSLLRGGDGNLCLKVTTAELCGSCG